MCVNTGWYIGNSCQPSCYNRINYCLLLFFLRCKKSLFSLPFVQIFSSSSEIKFLHSFVLQSGLDLNETSWYKVWKGRKSNQSFIFHSIEDFYLDPKISIYLRRWHLLKVPCQKVDRWIIFHDFNIKSKNIVFNKERLKVLGNQIFFINADSR